MVITGWTQVVTVILGRIFALRPSYVALTKVVGQLPQIILIGQFHSHIPSAKHPMAQGFAMQDAVDSQDNENDEQQWTTLNKQMRMIIGDMISLQISSEQSWEEPSVLFYEFLKGRYYRTNRWMRDIFNPT